MFCHGRNATPLFAQRLRATARDFCYILQCTQFVRRSSLHVMADAANYPESRSTEGRRRVRARLAELGISLPVDDRILSAAEGSPLAQPMTFAGFDVGNRWCIHPMEGWDANRDGSPSPHTLRRWRNFGLSGAKLIWGGEAAAVRPDGRANPNQTLATESNRGGLAALLYELTDAHREAFGSLDGLSSACSSRTPAGSASRTIITRWRRGSRITIRCWTPSSRSTRTTIPIVWTDAELEQLIDDYVAAARLAHEVGFQFVDVKACHGYLLHEFLSARTRPGRFGGDLAGPLARAHSRSSIASATRFRSSRSACG